MSEATSEVLLTPSTSSSTTTTDSLASIPCNICRRQFSRYICPKCNIPYCSLTCFRSEAHEECSESFYKKELETQIRSEPSKSTEERRKMMEMLQRFEEESAEDTAALQGDESDDLADRLETLDLDDADYDDIWAALTPAERNKFMKALGDPSSDLAQQLLSSEELETQIIEPWWERPTDRDAEGPPLAEEHVAVSGSKVYGKRPSLLRIPPTMTNAIAASQGSGPSLLYNACAVLVAYAYTTRHFSTSPLFELKDPDRRDARQTLSRLLPFLVDKKSKTVLPTLSGMVTDVWSRFTPGTITAKAFSLLLRDASKLLRPLLITAVPATTPQNKGRDPLQAAGSTVESSDVSAHDTEVSAALGDIATLFSTPSVSAPAPKEKHYTSHKLTFYAAHVLATPSPVLHLLATELAAQAELVEREDVHLGSRVPPGRSQLVADEEQRRVGPHGDPGVASRAFIEELT